MPSPTGSRHEITIIREFNCDPSRAVQALVRLLERGDAAARLTAQHPNQQNQEAPAAK